MTSISVVFYLSVNKKGITVLTQECHTEFKYVDQLDSCMITNPSVDTQEKEKKQGPKRSMLPIPGLSKCQA